jgi:hypothetical protein
MDELEPNLAYAGLPINGSRPPGEAYWIFFEESVAQILATVRAAFI